MLSLRASLANACRLMSGLALTSGLAAVACSSSSSTVSGGCEALEVKECSCEDGSMGTRTCDSEGKRFSECDCSSSSGGTGGGSGTGGTAAQGGSSGSGSGGQSGGAAGSAGAGGAGNASAGGSSAGGSSGAAAGGATTGGSSSTGGAGGSGSISCPPGMAAIANTFCMDRWELKAQLPIAPASAPNQTPLTNYKPKTLQSNCSNAGKRLCTLEELADACSNGNTTLYPYGSSYIEAACGDTGLHDTGTLNSCVNSDQVYDLVGNVWELAEFGSDAYAPLFGGDHRRDGAATFSCCIRTTPADPYPAGCEALYDSSDTLDYGSNTTSVEVNAITHTKDVFDRDIDMGYRCCADPL